MLSMITAALCIIFFDLTITHVFVDVFEDFIFGVMSIGTILWLVIYVSISDIVVLWNVHEIRNTRSTV